MSVALTLMYEHLIEGKVHSADPLNLNPNGQKSNRKWFKTKWIKPEGGKKNTLASRHMNANSGERCQERMGNEENAADFILIC